MIKYINWNGGYGNETIDQVNRGDYKTAKEFKDYLNYLIGEYRLAYGGRVWVSSRKCKN